MRISRHRDRYDLIRVIKNLRRLKRSGSKPY